MDPFPEKKKIPITVKVKSVLILIQAHTEDDKDKFKDAAVEIAKELQSNGEQELALYIYAQFGMVNTFIPMDKQ